MVSLANSTRSAGPAARVRPGTLEILIGQLLGPSPGQGGQERGTGGRIVPYPHADMPAHQRCDVEEVPAVLRVARRKASKGRPSSGRTAVAQRARRMNI